MVKYSELQIGDYVLVSGTPRRVESVTKKKIGYHINPQTDRGLHYARLHDVEPIEVTEELMESQGFIKYPSVPYHAYIQKGTDATIWRYPSYWIVPDVRIRQMYVRVEFVHQLQQLDRMSGSKIDWKL